MSEYTRSRVEARIFTEECVANDRVDPALFARYNIKRGPCATRTAKACWRASPIFPASTHFEEKDGKKVPATASCGTAATTCMT